MWRMGACAPVFADHVTVTPDLRHDMRGDRIQVAEQPEMTLAECLRRVRSLVAGFDRDADDACAGTAGGRDQQLRFEDESFAGNIVQGEN